MTTQQIDERTPGGTREPAANGSTVRGSTAPGSTAPGSTVPGSTVPGSGRASARRAYARRQRRTAKMSGSRLLTPGRPVASAMNRAPFVVMLIAILGGGIAAVLWLNTLTDEAGMRTSTSRMSATDLRLVIEAMQRDVAILDATPRIAKAAAKLGMVPAGDAAMLIVDKSGAGSVLGTPSAVPGPPAPTTTAPTTTAPTTTAPTTTAPTTTAPTTTAPTTAAPTTAAPTTAAPTTAAATTAAATPTAAVPAAPAAPTPARKAHTATAPVTDARASATSGSAAPAASGAAAAARGADR